MCVCVCVCVCDFIFHHWSVGILIFSYSFNAEEFGNK